MESLNLNNLANSLPNSNLANAEKDLMNNFKAAALSLTTLYRSSRRTSKRAYHAGYATACQDLLMMIQQGVSAGESNDPDGGGMTIGRIMDYIEARLEAIKSREEEEDEDEERDRGKERERERAGPAAQASTRASTGPSAKPSSSSLSSIQSRVKDQSITIPLTPPSMTHSQLPPFPLSPSTPASAPLRLSSAPIPPSFPSQRTSKSRLSNTKDAAAIISPSSSVPFSFNTPNTAVLSAGEAPLTIIPHLSSTTSPAALNNLSIPDVAVGMKRRHNAMMLDSGAPPTPSSTPTGAMTPSGVANAGGSSRRRTRSSRGNMASAAHQLNIQDQNQSQSGDAMDIEEDGGRERKRVARR